MRKRCKRFSVLIDRGSGCRSGPWTATIAPREALLLDMLERSLERDILRGWHAKVAELVDALALGASGATRESSSLSFRTTSLVLNLLF